MNILDRCAFRGGSRRCVPYSFSSIPRSALGARPKSFLTIRLNSPCRRAAEPPQSSALSEELRVGCRRTLARGRLPSATALYLIGRRASSQALKSLARQPWRLVVIWTGCGNRPARRSRQIVVRESPVACSTSRIRRMLSPTFTIALVWVIIVSWTLLGFQEEHSMKTMKTGPALD